MLIKKAVVLSYLIFFAHVAMLINILIFLIFVAVRFGENKKILTKIIIKYNGTEKIFEQVEM